MLPPSSFERLCPHLQRVQLRRRRVLQEQGGLLSHAYFIERGAASSLVRSRDGSVGVEVRLIGRTAVAGASIALGATHSEHRCVVQVPGEALRIGAGALRQAMIEMPLLRQVLLGHVRAAMVQSSQLVLCTARHSVQQRLARWLLSVHDLLDGDDLYLTHQAIARALGVRRASVTTAIADLEAAGLLRRSRGRVSVLSRAGLEEAACGCYAAIRAAHDRIVCAGGTRPSFA
jgi:CRP-like cAMP-binding protein